MRVQVVSTLSSCVWHRYEQCRLTQRAKRYTVFSYRVLKTHELMNLRWRCCCDLNLLSGRYMGLQPDRPVATWTQGNSLGCLGARTVAWQDLDRAVVLPLI